MPAKSKANDDKKEPKTTETTKVADKAPEEKSIEEKPVEEPKGRAVTIEEVPDFSKSDSFIKEEASTSDTAEKEQKTPDESFSKPASDAKVSSFSLLDSDKPVPDAQEQKEEPTEPKAEPQKDSEIKTEDKPDNSDSGAESEMSSDDVKKWLKDVKPDTTKEVEKKGGSFFKTLGILLLVLAVVGAVVGGIFYYKASVPAPSMNDNEKLEPTDTPSDQITPTPEAVELNLSKYKVNVLNGSGTAGEAGKVETALEDAGFTSVETGNANSYDFTATEVSLKDDLPNGIYEAISEALGKTYKVEKSSTTLPDSSEYDAVITVGSTPAE